MVTHLLIIRESSRSFPKAAFGVGGGGTAALVTIGHVGGCGGISEVTTVRLSR